MSLIIIIIIIIYHHRWSSSSLPSSELISTIPVIAFNAVQIYVVVIITDN